MSPWFETTSSFRRSTAPSQVTGKFIVAVIKSAASSQPLGGLFLKIFLLGFVNLSYHMACLRKWRAPHATWRSNTVLDPHATRLPHKHSLGHMRAKHKSPSPPDEDFHHRSTRSRRPAVPVPSYLDRGGPKIPFWHPRFAAFGSADVADQMSPPPPPQTRGDGIPQYITNTQNAHARACARATCHRVSRSDCLGMKGERQSIPCGYYRGRVWSQIVSENSRAGPAWRASPYQSKTFFYVAAAGSGLAAAATAAVNVFESITKP